MVALGLSRTDIDPSADEADVEEVVGTVAITVKKWSIEDDQLLISSWVNDNTYLTIGTDRKRLSVWGKIAAFFNEHSPQGSSIGSAKRCNGRWLRCYPLINK